MFWGTYTSTLSKLPYSFPLPPNLLTNTKTKMKYTTTIIASLAALLATVSAAPEPTTLSTVYTVMTTTLYTTNTHTTTTGRLMAPDRLTQTLPELNGTIIADDASSTDPALASAHQYMSTYTSPTATPTITSTTAGMQPRQLIRNRNDGEGKRVEGPAFTVAHQSGSYGDGDWKGIPFELPTHTQTLSSIIPAATMSTDHPSSTYAEHSAGDSHSYHSSLSTRMQRAGVDGEAPTTRPNSRRRWYGFRGLKG